MKKSGLAVFALGVLLCVPGLLADEAVHQERIRIGAYYFDGWSGVPDDEGYTYHITKRLVNEFPDREPVWGWRADTIEIMTQQIDYAADYGIAFFAFCWYYPEAEVKETTSNNALELFLKAPNKNRLHHTLLVANHAGFRIGPGEWDVVSKIWIRYFQDTNYERLNGKPLLIFYSAMELYKSFESAEAAKQALDQLRKQAEEAGLGGVTIAGGVLPNEPIREIDECGFDLLTGYNYPCYGFDLDRSYWKHPYENMIISDLYCWNYIKDHSKLPYMPTLTIGWDMRPWEPTGSDPKTIYFVDQTPGSITKGVTTLIDWVRTHPNKRIGEPLALIYAWNENGEGGYMTPTKHGGTMILESVKKAIDLKGNLSMVDPP